MTIHIVPILRDNYAFIIEGPDQTCLIIDPGQVAPIDVFIRQHDLKPVLILNTHHHADHVAGNAELKSLYNVAVIAPKAELLKIPGADQGVAEGDVISECGVDLRVIETPGHTKGHVIFHAEKENALFAGDTIFSMGCGRLLEGTAEDMYASLQKIKSLFTQTQIYCGHEYTQANGNFALHLEPDNADILQRMKDVSKFRSNNLPTIPVTLETELKTNPFLRAGNMVTFADRRRQKDVF